MMYLEYLGGENLDSWVTLPNGRHQAIDEIITRFKGDDGLNYTFVFYPGFTCDGGSVPWCFRWFVPSWDETNHELNIAYALHDGLYATELLPRRAADDLLESMLYVAGLSQLRASTVKWAVCNYGQSHYGKSHDTFEDGLFFKMARYKL
jgi:hypothetical protein